MNHADVSVVSSCRPENIDEMMMKKKSSSDSALDKNTKFILQDTGQQQTPRMNGDFQEPN